MKRIRVINTGKKTRYRLGIGFIPNVEHEIEVTNRQFLTIKAVKDFKVDVLGEESTRQEAQNKPQTDEINIADMNIKEVLETVRSGKLSVEEAIAKEVTGKNRPTLLEKLESLEEGA